MYDPEYDEGNDDELFDKNIDVDSEVFGVGEGDNGVNTEGVGEVNIGENESGQAWEEAPSIIEVWELWHSGP